MATMDLNVDFETVKMVHDSWDEVKKIPDVALVAGELLFRNIFRIAPGAWIMFPFGKGYESAEDEMFQSPLFQAHAQKVVGMLDTAVHLLGPDLQILQEALVTLGAQHVGYGVFPDHYPIVGEALIETLATALGDDFTPELQAAWAGVYGFVTDHMLKGAKEGLSRIIIHKVLLPQQPSSSGSSKTKTKNKKEKKTITLEKCLAAMLPEQKELYYVTSDDITPVLERLLQAGVTVLKMGPKQAGMVVTNLQKYLNRQMINVADIEKDPVAYDLSFLPPPPDAKAKANSANNDDLSDSSDPARRSPSPKSVTKFYNNNSHGLDFNEAKDFCRWFQTTLGPQRVLACTPTCEFASLPARIIPYEGMDIQQTLTKTLRRSLSRSSSKDASSTTPPSFFRSKSEAAQQQKQQRDKKRHVEINPSHEFIVELHKIRSKHPDIATLMAHQIHDHCMLQENASPPRPSDMVNRMTDICMLLLKSKNQESSSTQASC